MAGKREAFKSKTVRVQAIRVKCKADKFREPWLTRDVVALGRKKKDV